MTAPRVHEKPAELDPKKFWSVFEAQQYRQQQQQNQRMEQQQ